MQEHIQHPDTVTYWTERFATYDCLADTVLDLVAAPDSQAHVERVFPVCGMLTSGRCNRMSQSLEMCARLKLNAKVFA